MKLTDTEAKQECADLNAKVGRLLWEDHQTSLLGDEGDDRLTRRAKLEQAMTLLHEASQ